MLRVLHIDTERGWRGGERQALWLARELVGLGHVSIVAARRAEPLARRAASEGLPVVPCAPVGEFDVRVAWRLRRVIRAERVDIVHAHTAHAVSLGALATVGTRVPLVVSRRVDFALRRNAGTRWKYGRAAVIIAISHAVADVLRRSGVSASRIVVVPDGTDLHRVVAPASAESLASRGVRGRPLVVQVAQLVAHKDPLNIVRAVATARQRLPRMAGLLVGDGPLRSAVESEVKSLGLEGALQVVGYRPDADALLASADIACLSSREEGMGSVLLDALAFGVPVAATRAGGIPEVVEEGVTGLLAPAGSPGELADVIVRLATDEALRAKMSAAARARAADFSVAKMAERTLAVYARVLGPPEGPDSSRARSASSDSSASVTNAP